MEASLTEISRLVGSVCQDIESQIVTPLVEDEILYGLENFGVARDEGVARMEDVLGAMGIEELRSCEISSLSGGQKQKVAIASILALRPRVLVLDEPTAELDPAASRGVFDLLKQYSREHKITVVAVEQKIALLCDYADMIVVMEEGSVRVSGTPDEVLVRAPELYAMGVNVPRVTSLTRSLRDKGVYEGPVCRTVSQGALHIAQSLRAKGQAIPPDAAPSGSFAECVASCEKEAGKGEKRTRRNEKAGLAALEFHDVYAGYEGELAVLKGVDFAIQEGEFVAFVGANGAGKIYDDASDERLDQTQCGKSFGVRHLDGVMPDERACAHGRVSVPKPRPSDLQDDGARGASVRVRGHGARRRPGATCGR